MNYLTVENEIPENQIKIQKINQHISNKNPAVIYFYKNGCPFCERTTPEWDKLPNYLPQNNNILVVRINKDYYEHLQSVGEKPILYPNIRYVHGSRIDTFKKEGDERNAKNLAMWIQQQPSLQLYKSREQPPPQLYKSREQPSLQLYKSREQPPPQLYKSREQPPPQLYKSREHHPKRSQYKKPKYKKNFKKRKFTKRKRRIYYM
jgi:hypothetical protein